MFNLQLNLIAHSLQILSLIELSLDLLILACLKQIRYLVYFPLIIALHRHKHCCQLGPCFRLLYFHARLKHPLHQLDVALALTLLERLDPPVALQLVLGSADIVLQYFVRRRAKGADFCSVGLEGCVLTELIRMEQSLVSLVLGVKGGLVQPELGFELLQAEKVEVVERLELLRCDKVLAGVTGQFIVLKYADLALVRAA